MIPLLFCGHTSAWILLLFHCIVIYYRDHRQNPKKKENDRWKTAQGLDRLDEAIDFTGYGESLPICPDIERQSTETLHPCGRHLDHFPWKFSRTHLITQKICLLSCVSRRAYDGYPYHHLHFLPRVCMSISIYYIKSNPPLNRIGFARADVL